MDTATAPRCRPVATPPETAPPLAAHEPALTTDAVAHLAAQNRIAQKMGEMLANGIGGACITPHPDGYRSATAVWDPDAHTFRDAGLTEPELAELHADASFLVDEAGGTGIDGNPRIDLPLPGATGWVRARRIGPSVTLTHCPVRLWC